MFLLRHQVISKFFLPLTPQIRSLQNVLSVKRRELFTTAVVDQREIYSNWSLILVLLRKKRSLINSELIYIFLLQILLHGFRLFEVFSLKISFNNYFY
jgi:hypothetical protein